MVPQDTEEVSVLKLRIKYSKLGNLRFIGHLDVMRYFQKEIRRAGIKVSYSKGYSPHQIISFAAPLAMGVTSDGEYFDGEFDEITTSEDMINALNAVSVDEMRVSEIVLLPDNEGNSMSVVAASDYVISFNEGNDKEDKLLNAVEDFMAQPEIIILKKTKKSEREENIKPGIMKLEVRDGKIYMLLSTGSVYNLKPDLVMQALCTSAGVTYSFFDYHIHRLETYMDDDKGELVPLYMAGTRF